MCLQRHKLCVGVDMLYIVSGNTCFKPSGRSRRTDQQREEQITVHDGNWGRALSALCQLRAKKSKIGGGRGGGGERRGHCQSKPTQEEEECTQQTAREPY